MEGRLGLRTRGVPEFVERTGRETEGIGLGGRRRGGGNLHRGAVGLQIDERGRPGKRGRPSAGGGRELALSHRGRRGKGKA